MNLKRFFVTSSLLLGASLSQPPVLAQNPVIYKHVDDKGRVTYANSPIKGAAVLELAPLAVVQSATSQSATARATKPLSGGTGPTNETGLSSATNLGQLHATPAEGSPPRAGPIQKYGILEPDTPENFSPANVAPTVTAQPVARVTTAKPGKEAVRTPAAASGWNPTMTAQHRRDEVRRRIIEGELEAEAQFLAEAKAALLREQNKSTAMRALRTAVLSNERAGVGNSVVPDDGVETKAFIERHFERVRSLQDQVAMHEENIQELRAQLPTAAKNSGVTSALAANTTASSPPKQRAATQ